MILNSIRWRLQLWHGLILLVVLAGFGLTAYHLQHALALRLVDQQLQQRLGPLLNRLHRPPPEGPPPFGAEFGPPPRLADARGLDPADWWTGASNTFYYLIWRRDGRALSRSASAPAGLSAPPPRSESDLLPVARQRGIDREVYQFTPPGECVLVGRSIAPELSNLHELALWLLGLGSAVLTVGLAGGWWLASRAIRPIADISTAASRIASGDLTHRIDTADTDTELGRLATLLNATFGRLEAAFTQQVQFTSDASHELRTPVSVILTQTQSALGRERSAPEYRDALLACQRAAQRMRRLIESLLALSRLDAGQEPLTRAPLNLAQVVHEAVELIQPLAAEHHVTFHERLDPAPCSGDSERLGQVITNLLTNAIVHHRPQGEGEVRVKTSSEQGFAVLEVADNGPGIAPEDLPHLFKRFYRADKARARSTGGSGLGLAISKAIVDAHGGDLTARNEPSGGAVFIVRVPA